MFFGHPDEASIGPHYENNARWGPGSQTVECGFQVFLVPGEVCHGRLGGFADRLSDEPMNEMIFADFFEISSHPSFS